MSLDRRAPGGGDNAGAGSASLARDRRRQRRGQTRCCWRSSCAGSARALAQNSRVGGRVVAREEGGPQEADHSPVPRRRQTPPAHGRATRSLRLLLKYAPTACLQMPAGLVPDPGRLPATPDSPAPQERLIRETGDFFEAASRLFPILVVVEDLQWADPASVDLLHHLGSRLARSER